MMGYRLEVICKFLVAVGIVLLLLGIIQQSGFPNVIKGMMGITIGMLFIGIGNIVEKNASSKVQRFFSLLPENSTTYCCYKKTTNKQTHRRRPTPPIPYKEANQYHHSTYESEHTTKHPLKDTPDKIKNCIHRLLLYRALAGLYGLLRRLSTKMQKNQRLKALDIITIYVTICCNRRVKLWLELNPYLLARRGRS